MPSKWKESILGRVFGLQKAKTYILYHTVDYFLKKQEAKKGVTIYQIYAYALPIKPAQSLVYRYVKELCIEHGLLKTVRGKCGERKARYLPTKAGIRTYYQLKEQFDRKKEAKMPASNISWKVSLANSINSSLSKELRKRFYDIEVDYTYDALLLSPDFTFRCVRNDEAFAKSLSDPSIEFTWQIQEHEGLKTSEDIFNIETVEIEVFKDDLRMRRKNFFLLQKKSSETENEILTINYSHPDLSDELYNPIRGRYRFHSIIKKDGYFFIKVPWQAEGFRVLFDYKKTDIDKLTIVHYFGATVPKIKHSKSTKLVEVEVEGKIYPGDGVAFIWSIAPQSPNKLIQN